MDNSSLEMVEENILATAIEPLDCLIEYLHECVKFYNISAEDFQKRYGFDIHDAGTNFESGEKFTLRTDDDKPIEGLLPILPHQLWHLLVEYWFKACPGVTVEGPLAPGTIMTCIGTEGRLEARLDEWQENRVLAWSVEQQSVRIQLKLELYPAQNCMMVSEGESFDETVLKVKLNHWLPPTHHQSIYIDCFHQREFEQLVYRVFLVLENQEFPNRHIPLNRMVQYLHECVFLTSLPPKTVWDLLIDVKGYEGWHPAIKEVEVNELTGMATMRFKEGVANLKIEKNLESHSMTFTGDFEGVEVFWTWKIKEVEPRGKVLLLLEFPRLDNDIGDARISYFTSQLYNIERFSHLRTFGIKSGIGKPKMKRLYKPREKSEKIFDVEPQNMREMIDELREENLSKNIDQRPLENTSNRIPRKRKWWKR